MKADPSPLFWETISDEMRQVIMVFARTEVSTRFYLAGGTALALQLGHRRSYDLDYFTPSEDVPSIREQLAQALDPFEPVLADTAWGNLVFLAGGVRVGFYGYGYPLVAPLRVEEDVSIASLPDIGLMKLDALQSRASRKDFHDLYALGQHMTLREILDLASRKYAATRDFEAQVIKRLPFFERADAEAPLLLIEDVPWEEVKAYFRKQAIELSRDWFE